MRNYLLSTLVFSALACVACAPRDTAKESPAEVRSAESKTAPVIQDERPIIAAFGDSLSAGFGAEPGKSFPDYVQHLIDAEGYRYRVYNAGVSGDTTSDGLERLSDVLGIHPAIVILEFGGNDGLRGLPVVATKANLAQMIEALQKSGAKVLLAGITLPRNYGRDYIASFDKIFVELAERYRVPRIPFLLDQVGGIPRLMQRDGIHPTSEGNAIVAKTVFRYLRPMLVK